MWKTVVMLCACTGVLMVACSKKSSPTAPVTFGQWINYLHISNDTIPDYVVAIVVDAGGSKWFGSSDPRNENLYSLLKTSNETAWTGYNTANGMPNSSVQAIAIDSQGNKWVGFLGAGVAKFNGTTWTTYTVDSGLVDSNNVVQCITIDKQGNQWFGTSAGFSKRSSSGHWTNYYNTFGTVDSWGGFNPNNIHCIAVDSAGIKWIGNDVGLFRFNENDTTKDTSYFLSFGCNGITLDNHGNKWVSTDGGLGKVNSAGAAFFVFFYYSCASVLDRSGNLWVATQGDSGVVRIDTATYQVTNYPGLGPSFYNTFSIALDSNGNIWCGSDQGIHQLPLKK